MPVYYSRRLIHTIGNSGFENWIRKVQRHKKFNSILDNASETFYALEQTGNQEQVNEYLDELEYQFKITNDKMHEYLNSWDSLEKPLAMTIKDIQYPLTLDQQNLIQKATVDQSDSLLWKELRQNRITASKAGYVYRTNRVAASKLWNETPITEAMRYGNTFETLAIKAVETRHNLLIAKSGIWLDIERPFLAASPDGLIYSDQGDLTAVVEIKCPFSAQMLPISQWVVKARNNCLHKVDHALTLRNTHDYYYQIQMQMGITKTRRCIFAVYTGVDLHSEWVDFDEILWIQMIEKFDSVAASLGIQNSL
jgi:hypothetical protein